MTMQPSMYRGALVVVFLLAGCSRDEWTGVVYPDRNNLLEYTRLAPNTSLEACREAVRRHAAAAGWDWERLDYECGLNCKPYTLGSDLHVCEKTLR